MDNAIDFAWKWFRILYDGEFGDGQPEKTCVNHAFVEVELQCGRVASFSFTLGLCLFVTHRIFKVTQSFIPYKVIKHILTGSEMTNGNIHDVQCQTEEPDDRANLTNIKINISSRYHTKAILYRITKTIGLDGFAEHSEMRPTKSVTHIATRMRTTCYPGNSNKLSSTSASISAIRKRKQLKDTLAIRKSAKEELQLLTDEDNEELRMLRDEIEENKKIYENLTERKMNLKREVLDIEKIHLEFDEELQDVWLQWQVGEKELMTAAAGGQDIRYAKTSASEVKGYQTGGLVELRQYGISEEREHGLRHRARTDGKRPDSDVLRNTRSSQWLPSTGDVASSNQNTSRVTNDATTEGADHHNDWTPLSRLAHAPNSSYHQVDIDTLDSTGVGSSTEAYDSDITDYVWHDNRPRGFQHAASGQVIATTTNAARRQQQLPKISVSCHPDGRGINHPNPQRYATATREYIGGAANIGGDSYRGQRGQGQRVYLEDADSCSEEMERISGGGGFKSLNMEEGDTARQYHMPSPRSRCYSKKGDIVSSNRNRSQRSGRNSSSFANISSYRAEYVASPLTSSMMSPMISPLTSPLTSHVLSDHTNSSGAIFESIDSRQDYMYHDQVTDV